MDKEESLFKYPCLKPSYELNKHGSVFADEAELKISQQNFNRLKY